MSLFNKPKKNIRRRIADNEDGDENDVKMEVEDEHNIKQVQENIANIKEKKNRKKQTVLSFEEELNEADDGEIFQVKKSTQSKKLMKILDRERKKKKEVKIEDEKMDVVETEKRIIDEASDLVLVVKNTEMPANTILNGREAEMADYSSAEEDETKHKFTPQDHVKLLLESKPKATLISLYTISQPQSQFSLDLCKVFIDMRSSIFKRNKSLVNSLDVVDDVVKKTQAVPDVAGRTVREKCQQVLADDQDFQHLKYIGMILKEVVLSPMQQRFTQQENGDNLRGKWAETSFLSDKSRLVREDDHDGSDEEERVNMEVNMDARTREERREAFMAAQNKAAGEDSDKGEEDDWESQQIRKGVTGAQCSMYQQYMGIPAMPPMILMPQPEPLHTIHEVPTLGMHCFGADDSKLSTPQSIVNKLKERLVSLKEVHHRHTQDRDRVADDLVTLSAEREDLESEGPALVQRFRFYQELRGYVTDLVECLDEKVAVIHALEQRMLALLKKRSDDLMERRRQDVRDQSEELSPLSSQYLYNRFNRSGATPSQRRNREEEESRIRRAAEREGRRTRRRRAREGKYTPTRHVEGMSSDDEMTELEAVAFRTQKDLIESDARLVFEDVVEEFCSVRSIVKRFESWRFTDSDAYKEAYVSLCLPKVLGPIIRLKLITWSPLQESVEFERHKWYDTLLLYGLKESENEELLRQDPDLRLVPTIVEKVILPKLTQLVEAQWDPLSTSQSLRLVGLTNRLIQEYPTMLPTSKYLEKFLSSVIAKMKSCVENDVFIPIYPKLVMESKGGGINVFFQHQFGSALKLLRNLLSWQGLVSDRVLQDVALGSVLNRYLLAALRTCEPTDAANKCTMIVSTFPRGWLQQECSVPHLSMFVNQIKIIAQCLDVSTVLGR
uniref:GCF C-terminal domain-containing protein n=1 Tax=Timema genevievae TaxID=629358 RepID=A0A7R9JW36_TIMGE|nr:unnamed protein product [Timema genevievae]